jgi:hypothetical protein
VKDGSGFTLKHKTEIKKCFNNENSLKFVASNKDYTAEWEYAPKDLNKDGKCATFELESKCTPVKGTWEAKAECKFGGYGNDTVKLFSELQYDTNDKQNNKVTFSQNVLCSDKYHSAVKVVASTGAKVEVTDIYGILGFNNMSFGNLWLRGDFIRNFYGVGMSTTVNNSDYAAEVQYDVGNSKNEGLFGVPLFLRAGSCFNLDNKQKLSTYFYLGKQWMAKTKWEVPVDEKFKLVISDKVDMLEFLKMSPKAAYKLGFALEMKI